MKSFFRNHSTAAVPGESRPRRGMTLIEVIMATSILSGSLLGMGTFIARYANVTGNMAIRTEANELVADRIEEVKGALRYTNIEALYAKTESTIPNHPGFKRQTIVTHTGGDAEALYDYKTVTVIVTLPALKNPAKKSTVISVF